MESEFDQPVRVVMHPRKDMFDRHNAHGGIFRDFELALQMHLEKACLPSEKNKIMRKTW